MSDKVEVRWEVADGYVGSRRPQRVMIDHSEIADCEDEAEVRELVEGSIRDSFEQKVSPDWEPSEVDKVVELWKEIRSDNRD